ncbi:2-C-methyl-D-erythritol 2,4-cyclodiphosphate synthase, partial [Candidatus Peregrinibacteria bacterium RIFOXYA2_FULL_33_7]
IMAAKKFGASGVAHKAKDTIKVVDKNKFVKETLSRDFVVLMQTPQVIQYQLLINAYKKAMKEKFIGTDDLSLVERLGGKVKIIPASKDNFKITNFSDIQLGENILKNDLIRTGIGVDSHEFDKNKFGLILGGVKFNQYRSMKANSDGDVILHSLFNAISSASGQGSISEIADEMCLIKGIKDSREYLEVLLDKNKIIFLNISVALECKIPLITPISDKIKKSLSKILDLDIQNIGITATSGENMGPFGEGKGIRCISMVLFKIGPNRSLKI